MNYLDLFHGIGGFAIGAYWAGMKFENHYCSDIEPYCQKLYKLRFPDSIQLGDITKIKAEDLPYGEWIITGGFPCQDISIAGKGAGITGARSGLWFEYWRLIRDLRPRFAIMENVGALTFRGLDAVLGSLAEIGYNAEWQDIRASDMGAPHRRERIWIVAYPGHMRGGGKIKGVLRVMQKDKSVINQITGPGETRNMADPERIGKKREEPENRKGRGVILCGEREGAMANATIERLERQEPEGGATYEQRLPTEHGGWNVEPAVCGVADGIPTELDGYQGRVAVKPFDRQNRLRGLGNAIVPQIAELLFNQIKNLGA